MSKSIISKFRSIIDSSISSSGQGISGTHKIATVYINVLSVDSTEWFLAALRQLIACCIRTSSPVMLRSLPVAKIVHLEYDAFDLLLSLLYLSEPRRCINCTYDPLRLLRIV